MKNKLAQILKNQRGIALVQVMFIASGVTALTYLLLQSTKQVSETVVSSSRSVSVKFTTSQIMGILRSPTACNNTFGNGTFDGSGNYSTDPVPTILDDQNIIRFAACADINNPTSSCASAMTNKGRLYLSSIRIVRNGTANGFTMAQVNLEFLARGGGRGIVTRSPLIIDLNGSTLNKCQSVYDPEDTSEAFMNFCENTAGNGLLTGKLDKTNDLLCKSLRVGHVAQDDNQLALDVNGGFHVRRDLLVQGSLDIGFTDNPGSEYDRTDTFPASPAPATGDLFYIGNALSSGGVIIGSLPATAASTASGQMRVANRILLDGDSASAPANPGIYGSSSNELFAGGSLIFLNHDGSEDTNYTRDLSGSLNTVVSTGWVRRKLANIVGIDAATANTLFGETLQLATGNAGDVTTAERTIIEQFCNGMRINNTINGVTYPLTSNTATGTLCALVLSGVTINKCDSLGNCTDVYGNQICLGGQCKTGAVSLQQTTECIAAGSHVHDHGVNSYTVRSCGADRWISGANCCKWRVQ